MANYSAPLNAVMGVNNKASTLGGDKDRHMSKNTKNIARIISDRGGSCSEYQFARQVEANWKHFKSCESISCTIRKRAIKSRAMF